MKGLARHPSAPTDVRELLDVVMRGHDERRRVPLRGVLPLAQAELDAVHPGHHQVEHDERIRPLLERVEARTAVARQRDFETLGDQHRAA